MKRSIELDVDPRWIRNPTNNPLATVPQRMAAAAQTRKCIEHLGAVLSANFDHPPLSITRDGWTTRNHWTVTLTRIAPGTLDPLTGGASMKAVQDAVARWCGVKHERDPIWTWIEPMRQEKAGQHVYRIRIQLDDLAPGEDRVVVLAETASEGRAAKSRVKRAANESIARAAKPTANDPRDAYERVTGATDMRARSTGEQAAAKIGRRLFGKKRRKATPVHHASLGAVNMEPTGDIALVSKPAKMTLTADERATLPQDLTAMRTQARSVACNAMAIAATGDHPFCSAAIGQPCCDVPSLTYEYGVHTSRARAAGLPPYPSAADLDAGTRPVCEDAPCADCNGHGYGGRACESTADTCPTCKGTGKVKRWRWVMGPAKRADGPKADKAGRKVTGSAECHGTRRMSRPDGDPGEERSPRQLVPCPRASCFAALAIACTIKPGEAVAFGVHVERARAAGARVTPRENVNGAKVEIRDAATRARRVVLAAGTPLPVYLALPWMACLATECGGSCTTHRPVRWKALDATAAERETVTIPVPAEHRGRFGSRVQVHRREHVSKAVGRCWVYEMRETKGD